MPLSEIVWRERLQVALRRYQLAKATTAKLFGDHVHRLAESPDGAFAYRKALQEEVIALSEYRRVLNVYYEVAIHGNEPRS